MAEITITVYGVALTVEYDYSPPEVGARERKTGLQLEPDWEEEITINEVKSDECFLELLDERYVREVIEERILFEINTPPDEQ
jgi:hypothetical protein